MRRKQALAVLLWFAVAGCASWQARPNDDRAQLLELHRKALRAHLEQNIAMLLEDESEDYVVASRGEISHPSKREREQFLGPYLAGTKFSVYEDSVEPVVNVSADGTRGWVIARVSARGVQQTRSIEFVSAWIELYEKRDGRWLRTGNVSNFKERDTTSR